MKSSTFVGKTVLVTGATGFLGGALARRLASDGANVRALARNPSRGSYLRDVPGIEIMPGDLLDTARLQGLMQNCDVVFHVAAALGGPYLLQHRVNVEGTRSVMEAAAAAQVRRVVHVSTISVYGYRNRQDVTEMTPPAPGNDAYHHTKLAAEDEIWQAAERYGMEAAIIRPSMIYGPRSGAWTVKMFRLAGRRILPFIGSGHGSAYPIHVDDVVEMTTLLATHPRAVGQVFNCTPDPSPTWRTFLGTYQRLAGHQQWFALPPALIMPVAVLSGRIAPRYSQLRDLPDLVPFLQRYITYRMDKSRTLLGWEPRISLEEGIKSCVPYLKEKGLLP